MQRFFGLLLLLSALGLAVAGCGGNNGSGGGPGPVAKVTLSPTSLSLTRGGVAQITALVEDADGNQIFTETVTLASDNTNMATVSPTGLVCAGEWDANIVDCLLRPDVGTANIRATAAGVTSAPLPVSVHERVDRIIVTPVGAAPACTSVGATAPANTQKFKAEAYSNDPAVCGGAPPCLLPANTLGTFTFAASASGAATLAADTASPKDTTVATARAPGRIQISASLSGTTSIPADFDVCGPRSINIHVKNGTETSFSIATAATRELAADIVDVNGINIPGAPITWSSRSLAAATVSTAGVVTGVSPGVSQIIASCSPPSCNFGRPESVFSNIVTATVTGTATTTTVYVTSTDTGTKTILPIDTSNNTVGTAINFPANFDNPNSIVANTAGNRIFIGTEDGLLELDTATNATPTGHTSAVGLILGLNPRGNTVVLRDTTTPNQLLVFSAISGATETLTVPDPVAVAFTPDGNKLFIATGPGGGNRVYIFSPGTLFTNRDAGSPQTDVAVGVTGNYAFLANPGVETVEVCSNTTLGTIAGVTPVLLESAAKPVPPDSNRYQLIAVIPPNVRQIDVQDVVGAPCPGLPNVTGGTVDHFFPGVAAFTPRQTIVTADGSRVLVLTEENRVLVYDVGTNEAAGTTATINLAGAATRAFSGGVTLDGSRLFVGVDGVNEVQVFNPATGALVAQIAVSLKPQLVAVRPH